MGVSPDRGNDGRGVIIGGEDLHLPPPSYNQTVHRSPDHYGPVSGSGVEDGVKGFQAVVVVKRLGLGGDTDSGSGGRMDRGGGGDGHNRYGYGLNQWGKDCRKRNIRDGV